ncbi:type II toxin-antitoxin system RelE/ParE family toxin [[Haemophilus] felis]|uniref:Cytotoxic translational repressor of toxin-antitoxin stability system n=1 Tax=[Haemophilus] felis TaxID=123822 RepID=A0A1T0B246_9PAST|nr:type II toxin-antitoxin system RelE/ParE family toxin [[Haemophilus] felis]NBI40145.1 type II toxin-antitoxin system RelE/ParE family toxin [[Haemophilus] felis]OOS04177.1 cytotoxic translational repressor of toxin-antitoxin stability system [[Haemophilus] felis]
MKTLIIQRKAMKQLRRIPESDVIIDKCEELKSFPYCQNVKSLTNHKYPYRFRVGRYRVFFKLIGDTLNIVSVEEVKKRDERTY